MVRIVLSEEIILKCWVKDTKEILVITVNLTKKICVLGK